MSSDPVLYVLTVAVCVAVVSMAVQAIALLRVSRSAREMENQIKEFAPRIEKLIESTTRSVEESRKQIADISAKVNEVLDLSRKQLTVIDGFLAEASVKAKAQMERMELVVDDAMGRLQETITVLHEGFMSPVRGIQGLVAGLRAGISQFLRGRRPNVAQVTHDEEMFI